MPTWTKIVSSSSMTSSETLRKLSLKRSTYRNNPSMILPVSIDGSSENYKEQISHAVTAICELDSTSQSAGDNDLAVEALSGGLSNELFVVTRGEDCYLVRIHPEGGQLKSDSQDESLHAPGSLIDRERETMLLAWLAEQNMAPTLHGRFQNGRVEEFYRYHTALSVPEMVTFASRIAELMGKLHGLSVPESILPPCRSQQGDMFDTIDNWLRLARSFGKHQKLLDAITEEWIWLQQALRQEYWAEEASTDMDAIHFGREIVLCHMDAQPLNFLKASNGSLKMIDYEYSSRNPRVFDIANTFCEFAPMNELKADFRTDYPCEPVQDLFLRSYLESFGSCNPLSGKDPEQQEAFLVSLRLMIARSTLISHLEWSVWSLVQESIAHISFDYEQYARHRMDGYYYNKSKYWTGAI